MSQKESTKSKLETQIDEAWQLAYTVHRSISTLGRLIGQRSGMVLESADVLGIEEILGLIDKQADQLVDKLENIEKGGAA